MGWTARIIFWVLFFAAVSLVYLGLMSLAEASAPANENQILTPKQMWCSSQGGEFGYKVTKTFKIPCLTKTHAIFNDAETLVEYMMKYQKEFGQVPALFIKQ